MTNKHWSANFVKWLKDQILKHKDLTLELQIDRLEKLRKLQLRANTAVRQLGMKPRHKELYSLLLSVPGIGSLTAMLLISELIDMRRFSNVDHLMSYVGFIPTTSGSGEKERRGHLTKRCNGRIRSALVESSWVAIRNDPGLMLKYGALKKRMTGQEAIIRIARNLLIKIRAVWLSGEVYKKGIS
jgi:transposase